MVRYKLIKAHHPSMFEKGVWAVHFSEVGKPLVDRYSKFTQVLARNRIEAIRKAKKEMNIYKERLLNMGQSHTLVYQIGRFYMINGIQYLAIREAQGIVTFESYDINNPVMCQIQRKQQIR